MSVDFNIADFFKMPVKIFAAIAIGTGIILFLPDSFIEKLYLISFREQFGFVIGLVFVISLSIVLVSAIVFVMAGLNKAVKKIRFGINGAKTLKGLDDYQKTIVYSLFDEINHTAELPMNDGAVRVLEQSLVIGKATNQYAISDVNNPVFPYLLHPWAVKYLKRHKEMVSDYKNVAERTVATMENVAKNRGSGYEPWGSNMW